MITTSLMGSKFIIYRTIILIERYPLVVDMLENTVTKRQKIKIIDYYYVLLYILSQ